MGEIYLDSDYRLQEAFGCSDVTSTRMRRGIAEWFRLYYGGCEAGSDPCLQIPYTVVRKLTRAVFGEYRAEGGSGFVTKVIRAANEQARQAVELALVGGESYLKPCFDGHGWHFALLSRRDVLVFGRDRFGRLTDVGTVERSVAGRLYYTLLERQYVEDGYLTIENKLYRSAVPGVLGSRVSLKCHPIYCTLPDRFTFPEKMDSVCLVQVRNPGANCIDGSPDAVSVFAPAVGLIRNLARNEALLTGEFERGQSRIVVSRDMLRDGELKDNVFVGLDEDPQDVGITVFSPALREQSYLARKQAYLRDVENVIGLKRGILSQVEAAQRTATEITSSQGEYSLTIMDFQRMWERALRDAVGLCAKLGRHYGQETDEGLITVHWGNGVLFDN